VKSVGAEKTVITPANYSKSRGRLLSTSMEKIGPLLGLFLLILIVSFLNTSFIEPTNILNLLRQVAINALIAYGMTFVILTGGIDLSVGSILAFSGVLTGDFILKGMDPVLAVVLGCILGAFMGAVNGLFITLGRVAPFIATLATMTLFRGLAMTYTNGNPFTGVGTDYSFQLLGKGYFFGIPVPVVTMLIVFGILWTVLHKTAFGRKTYAIGGNEKAALISGIKVNRVKIIIYSLSGLMAALAGAILTSRLNSAQPGAGTSYELDAIAAVVLGGSSLAGGKGRIFGTLIGVLIIGVLNNGLNLLGVSSFYQMVIKGIVILIAVLLDRKKSS
jgi:ribose transport system permease protein